jgi:hypothetical protein
MFIVIPEHIDLWQNYQTTFSVILNGICIKKAAINDHRKNNFHLKML